LLFHLGKDRKHQDKAYEEVMNVVGSEEVNDSHLDKLKFIECCVNETLRILPSDPMARTATEDMVIHDYFIPKGTSIQVTFAKIHGSDQYWENPTQFIPERWSDSNARQESIPFSYGPRICIGMDYTLLELKLFMVIMLQNFSWSVPKEFEYKLKPFCIFATPKSGLPIILEKRRSSDK